MAKNKAIRADLNAPEIVYLPAKGTPTISIDVLGQLHNTGKEDFVVEVPDKAHEHEWLVFDESMRVVLRPEQPAKPKAKPKAAKTAKTTKKAKAKPLVAAYTSLTIPAGRTYNDPHTLVLDAKKLKNDRTYTIYYRLWGYPAEANFTAVRE